MRLLNLEQVLALQTKILNQSGGALGVRDKDALKSALAQPGMTFGGQDLYPTLVEKLAALGFSLINNHPFVDGNKRIGHASIEVNLFLNGYEIKASVDTQEEIILAVAAGQMSREEFTGWLQKHVVKTQIQ